MDYNRRAALRLSGGIASLAAFGLLGACSTTSAGTSLDMAKTYGDDLIAALLAAAATYNASPNANPIVAGTIVPDLEQAKVALDGATSASDARGIVLQILAAAQTAMPMLSPFLGAAGPYIPLAIAVLQAFAQSLPPPPAAPPTPPAALHAVGERYRAAHP